MIFSIHIPKTAGTSFRHALKALYGDKVALFYGANDPDTHPLLRAPRKEIVGRLTQLEDQGVEVLHGHYHLGAVESAVADPGAQVWTWVRDPVERVLSHYFFIREQPLKRRFDEGEDPSKMDLATFAELRRMRDVQDHYLSGADPASFAFAGLTERFELGLGLLFGEAAPTLRRRYNATSAKDAVADEDYARILALNPKDARLYASATRAFIDRLAEAKAVKAPPRPTVAGASFITRMLRKAR
ncbi:hypothetical protein JOD31_003664 [Methylopila capsulata]|uniref:Sulfotransferase family protein n=1 Tax=Methylopila capsulata TaxID=61654 RepID=A0A9W6IY45_9HYPH|nr:sulfotransferase family 2 domain-containing protein [Methylopila capsulata]MBM7853403.1 hypothetical protein [Methylopila capsulata]GLK57384.1 hypothetical protein GCM10008170_34040 [Methylopila capsulata]